MIFIVIILVLFVILYLFCLYLFHSVIDNKKNNIQPIGSSKYSSIADHTKSDENYVTENSEEVYIKSFDNLKLHAYDLDLHQKNYAILVHGYRGHALELSR